MTMVFYNGITLPYPDTISFKQGAVYDSGLEGSGTDWYCTEFDISVQTKINFNYLSMIAPDLIVNGAPATDNAAQIMAVIRSRLLQPRREFSITANGIELIPQPMTGNPGTVDAQNGPKPQSCSIIQLTTNLFLVTFHIIAHYWESNEVDPNNSPMIRNKPAGNVLYNRWTEAQDISETNFSTRTRTGKMMIRSDNVDGIIADQARTQMAIVGLPKRFIRRSSRYMVAADGLSLSYQIVDEQKFKLPPPPAYKATGSYTESSTLAWGHTRFGEVEVALEGAPDTDQDELADAAMAVATKKIRNRGAVVDSGTGNLSYIENCAIRVGLYDNWVQVNIRTMLNQGSGHRKDGIAGWFWNLVKESLGIAFGTSKLCETPLSDNLDTSPKYNPRGAVAGPDFLLQAAAYYDPSLQNPKLNPAAGQLEGVSPLAPGQAGKRREE